MSVATKPRRGSVSADEREALAHECPACGAAPGVWCRELHSRAARKPAASKLHVARGWPLRTCPTCGETPGWPCVRPDGQPAKAPHAARRRRPAEPRDLLARLAPGPQAAHAALIEGGAMTATELARALYGPSAPARRVTNQLVALRRRRLAVKDRATGRWEAVDV